MMPEERDLVYIKLAWLFWPLSYNGYHGH
jgi:hypothetical protein